MFVNMHFIPDTVFHGHRQKQDLVALVREGVDENPLDGFILDYDEEWILVQRVFEFIFDGVTLVRRGDVSSIIDNGVCRFHKRLLQIEGKMADVAFDMRLPAAEGERSVFSEFVSGLPGDKVVICEDERNEVFLIGFIEQIGSGGGIFVKYFDGEGVVDDEIREMREADLTMFSINSSYSLYYERYFRRSLRG